MRANTGSTFRLLRGVFASILLGVPAVCAVVFSIELAVPASVAEAQNAAKTIEGKVLNATAAPLPGSIIYLQDQKTNIIKTFIADPNGSYRFGQLPASTDYRIWAEYKGEKSKEKLISSFDSKLIVTLDFKIGN